MHHANVDRLTAMYQAVHPGRTLTPQPAAGNFARIVSNDNEVDDMNTPLAPFRKADASYFTSRDVSDVSSIWDFGYYYTEVPPSYRGNSAGLSAFTTSQVNSLYRSASASSKKRDGNFKRREWICHMAFNPSDVPGSAEVAIYFNNQKVSGVPISNSTGFASPSGVASGTGSLPQPTEAAKFTNGSNTESAYYVGSAASFHDAGVMSPIPMNMTGAVYLTDALIEAGCPSLDPKDVVPFLKTKLVWVIRLGGEQEIPLSQIPSLKVGVSSADVEYLADDTKLPVYGEFETHYDATEKKKGGFRKRDSDLVDSKPAARVPGGDVPDNANNYYAPSALAPSYVAPSQAPSQAPEYPSQAPEHPSAYPTQSVVSEQPTSLPCKTVVNNGATTVIVTVTATVCPNLCKESDLPVTNAFESVYSTAAKPNYDVYRW